jgi:hypothetical protein
MTLMRILWDDDCGGGLVTSELLFLFSTLVLGTVSGMVAVRQAALSELVETGQALMALNQSYSISGQSNTMASTAASSAVDATNTISLASSTGTNPVVSQIPLD